MHKNIFYTFLASFLISQYSYEQLSFINQKTMKESSICANAQHKLSLVSQNSINLENVRLFSLPKPSDLLCVRKYELWATYYRVHQAENVINGFPLLDLSGNRLGPNLTVSDWCNASLQGTVIVESQVYNYAGESPTLQVDCTSILGEYFRESGGLRFKVSRGEYGEGADDYLLIPFRTLAVDRNIIPLGSVIYIPEARGVLIELSQGERVAHDGYFFAADVGGAIRDNQIDVFLGLTEHNPFTFIKSRRDSLSKAYLINDPHIQNHFEALHLQTNN